MTDYEKFSALYSEIDELISKKVTSSSPEFKAWHMKVERFLIKEFGEDGIEYQNFKKTSFYLHAMGSFTESWELVAACRDGLLATKAVFEEYLGEMQEEMEEFSEDKEDNDNRIHERCFSKIFVVHGHDGELKEAVSRLVERAGITPIILSEQVSRGATVIEKLERYTDVPAAICLFTADDFGREKTEDVEQKRARQNVVFETGYLMGKLGRENTIIIAEGGIEIPSDLSGVVRTDKQEWKISLIKEMRDIGYDVDDSILL